MTVRSPARWVLIALVAVGMLLAVVVGAVLPQPASDPARTLRIEIRGDTEGTASYAEAHDGRTPATKELTASDFANGTWSTTHAAPPAGAAWVRVDVQLVDPLSTALVLCRMEVDGVLVTAASGHGGAVVCERTV